MTLRLLPLLLPLLVCSPLPAELTLFYLSPDLTETPVGSRISMPEVPSGDFADLRLRVRNTGSTNENVTDFFVRGSGFSLLTVPSLPWLLVPGLNLDVRLRFSPSGPGSYSGTLQLNGTQILVTGHSPETAALWVQSGGGWQMVSNAEAVDFGRIESNTKSTLNFAFRNSSLSAVAVKSVLLAPGAFELPSAPALPLALAPGAESKFTIDFAPLRGGVFRSTLTVDGGRSVSPAMPTSRPCRSRFYPSPRLISPVANSNGSTFDSLRPRAGTAQ